MSPSRCPNCNSPILQNQVICGECGVKLRSMMLNSKSTLSKHAKSGTTRKSIKLVLFAALLVTLNGGILIFIVTWDEYHYSNSFYYNPLNPPLNTVDVDLTSLFYPYNINYNSSPSSPIVKIDLDIKIKGLFIADTSFSDFFELIWRNWSGWVDFAIYHKNGIDFWDILSMFSLYKEKVKITINLRTDITYEIYLS